MIIDLTTTEVIVLRALLKRARSSLGDQDIYRQYCSEDGEIKGKWDKGPPTVDEMVLLGLESLEKKVRVK